VRIDFKHPTRTGATYTDISRDTFIARLAALVPPPNFNLVRYYGVFANRHKLRPRITPTPPSEPQQLPLFELRGGLDLPCVGVAGRVGAAPSGRVSWAKLLARVFKLDMTVCSRCGGPLRVREAVLTPDKIALHLHGARAPPHPAPPGQRPLFAG